MVMELRQLEYFAAVAAEGSFTAAAHRVHTTQPNISAQIRNLEHELGAALFDRAIDLDELRRHSLISLPEGAGIRAVFDAAASAHGAPVRPAIEASSPDAIIELVCSGMGTGILSESIAAADERVVGRVIRGVDTRARLGLVWRVTASPATRRFVEIAREHFDPAER